jgi:hypothetical protein
MHAIRIRKATRSDAGAISIDEARTRVVAARKYVRNTVRRTESMTVRDDR